MIQKRLNFRLQLGQLICHAGTSSKGVKTPCFFKVKLPDNRSNIGQMGKLFNTFWQERPGYPLPSMIFMNINIIKYIAAETTKA